MTTPVTFFVDPAWRRQMQHIPLLYPFWGNVLEAATPFHQALFERYSFDTTQYVLVDDPKDAQFILLPYNYNNTVRVAPELLTECLALAEKYKKPLLIDGTGDIERPISLPNTIVLRYGGYRFLSRKNEIHIPLYADDLLEKYCGGIMQIRQKTDIPSVGFSGWTKLSFVQEVRTIVKELPTRTHALFDERYRACKKGVFFRQEAIAQLMGSAAVVPHVLSRSSYSGHLNTVSDSPQKLRKEFVENLLQSDYGLDVRGDANASIRLFEILSLGRIPVIIDTERFFPFSEKIDYSSFSCVVDFRDLGSLPERIADFHAALSPERFILMQKNARAAYREYFRVDVLTRHLMKALRERILLMEAV